MLKFKHDEEIKRERAFILKLGCQYRRIDKPSKMICSSNIKSQVCVRRDNENERTQFLVYMDEIYLVTGFERFGTFQRLQIGFSSKYG